MIREFIENIDTTHIPIGPQADLLELLDQLNGMLPSHMPLNTLGVTRRFNWKRGTYKQIREVRDYLLGLHRPYKNVSEIFDKPHRNRRSYYMHSFERTVKNIDRMLMSKRWNGAVWLDDDNEINDLKQKAIEKAIGLFEEYDSYVNMTINKNVQYRIVDERVDSEETIISETINELYQFQDDRPIVLLNLPSQKVMVMHPFKDIVMNTYNLDRTTPMFRFRCGNMLGIHEISVQRLLYWAFGTASTRLHGSIRSKFWYKPELKGLKHPFAHYPPNYSNDANHDLDDWNIRYGSPSNTCYGNFNEIYGSNSSVNIIKWCENVFNWLTTFRVGDTHPLNSIETAYYGSPLVHDRNVEGEYYDRIGTNTSSCHDRMSSYYEDCSERNDICMTYCDDDLRNTCSGFKWDTHRILENSITSWYTDTIFKCHDKYYGDNPYGNEFLMDKEIYPGNFTLDFEHKNIDDDYPIYTFVEIDSNEQDMQKDMLAWVNSQTS